MRLRQDMEIPDFDNARVEALHMMTPETETTTHYCYALTRSFGPATTEFNDKSAEMIRHVFAAEDSPMIEAQQRNLGEADLMSRHPVMLSHDAGNVRVRRILAALIEQQTARAHPSSPTSISLKHPEKSCTQDFRFHLCMHT